MLRHDNLQWRISITLCWLCTNGVIAAVMKSDILEALGDIAGYDLTDKEMRKYHIWPQGIIPYYIDDFSFDKVLRDRIRSHLDQISKVTGLHFNEIPKPPKDDQKRWVFFLNRKGLLPCADVSYSNFTSDGVQKVVLGYDCIKSEGLAGVILSLVGVAPQHNSPDRDDYITINWKNILKEKHYLLKKMQPEDWMFSKLGYDFASAGHYNTHKYTLNGAETVAPKDQKLYSEGGKGLSAMDIQKIRTIYNYISFKGQNNIKVPECSKLFVTGSNFSNYKPVTKSNLPITEINSPIPPDDLTSENATNIISKEGNFNESNESKKDDNNVVSNESEKKLTDSNEIEDKNIKDEADSEEENVDNKNLNLESNNDTKIESNPNTDNEIQQQTVSPESQKLTDEENKTSENNATLLKSKSKKKLANDKMKQLLTKSDYETGDEGNNNNLRNQKMHHFQ